MRKHYATIITTLTFLIVAGLAVWFFANISWGPGSDIISLTIDLKELAAVEEVTASAVGDEDGHGASVAWDLVRRARDQ